MSVRLLGMSVHKTSIFLSNQVENITAEINTSLHAGRWEIASQM